MAIASDTVDTPSAVWEELYKRWELPLALRKGTDGMRAGGVKWLDREEAETQGQYAARLKRTFLHPAFDDTVERVVAKPFSKPITFRGELPERLMPMLEDVDGEGNNLDQFASELMLSAVTTGMSHVLVDFPRVDSPVSLAEERDMRLRPRFVHVPAERLFAWSWDRMPNGGIQLSSIRYKETREVEVGAWGSELRNLIHVYRFNHDGGSTYQAWEQQSDRITEGSYVPVEDPVPITFSGVPLVTYYTGRAGAMEAAPPLQGIADLNLAHYQVSSEHRNVLNVVGVAMLFRTGVDGKAKDAKTVISPRAVYTSSVPDARMEWVEHSGAGVEAIERYLKQTEDRMEVLGMQPFNSGTRLTATQRVMDESKTETTVQTWVRGLEDALTEAFRKAGEWIGEEVSEDFAVQVYNDFSVGPRVESDLRALDSARARRDIDKRTFLEELQRRGTLDQDRDLDEIIEATMDEGPDMSALAGVVSALGADETEEAA